MKNIHVLPTDKPSRLIIYPTLLNEFRLFNEPFEDWKHKRHIYITSDEEIKEGGWFLPQGHLNPHKLKGYNKINGDLESYNGLCYDISKCKKIILTTDQDLIKDGVQVIPEYFLIHYIMGNNPIEYVEIKEHLESIDTMKINYELIIPKEEPKQDSVFSQLEVGKDYKQEVFELGEEPKQETLEEASQRIFNGFGDITKPSAIKRALELVKWQQEQDKNKYSKKDLIKAFNVGRLYQGREGDTTFEEWFEQLKNQIK